MDRGTVAFWPKARIIRVVDDHPSVTLTATDLLFHKYTLGQEICLDESVDIGNTAEQWSILLEAHGYGVLTVREALELIQSAPDSTDAEQFIACLVRWFFIAKI